MREFGYNGRHLRPGLRDSALDLVANTMETSDRIRKEMPESDQVLPQPDLSKNFLVLLGDSIPSEAVTSHIQGLYKSGALKDFSRIVIRNFESRHFPAKTDLEAEVRTRKSVWLMGRLVTSIAAEEAKLGRPPDIDVNSAPKEIKPNTAIGVSKAIDEALTESQQSQSPEDQQAGTVLIAVMPEALAKMYNDHLSQEEMPERPVAPPATDRSHLSLVA